MNPDSLKDVCKLFSKADTNETISQLFHLFFTSQEISFLKMRYQIVQELLEQKLTQREIAKKLGVSISKITAGSKEIQKMNPKLRSFLENFLK